MKTKRIVWTIVFLGVTLAAIVMEVVAGIFHPAGTIPWTEYLARCVPWPIQLAAYVILAVWLPFHFWRHDHLRKIAFRDGFTVGKGIGYNGGRKDGERLRAASIVSPATLDLTSDEELADALRRRGWIVARPNTEPLLPPQIKEV